MVKFAIYFKKASLIGTELLSHRHQSIQQQFCISLPFHLKFKYFFIFINTCNSATAGSGSSPNPTDFITSILVLPRTDIKLLCAYKVQQKPINKIKSSGTAWVNDSCNDSGMNMRLPDSTTKYNGVE